GQAFGIDAPMNPGERDFRPRARERNITGRLLAPSPALVTPAENSEGGLLSRWVRLREALRARSSSWIDSASVSDGARAMLHAGLLGETEGAYSSVQRSFARTGLAHVLAVSGLHLALLAWFARFATRGLLPWRRAEPIVVALAVCVYLALAPANPPIVRAGVMTLGVLAADALGRRYDRLNVLAWTACAVVVARPTDASSVGFQLSFLAVGGIIVLAPR